MPLHGWAKVGEGESDSILHPRRAQRGAAPNIHPCSDVHQEVLPKEAEGLTLSSHLTFMFHWVGTSHAYVLAFIEVELLSPLLPGTRNLDPVQRKSSV